MRRNVFTTYDPNLPSGKKFVAVHVQNEDPLYFLVEVKSKVCELFAQITKFLNLLEPELFGLAIKCSDSYIFLDPLEKLSKYAPKPWRTQNNGMDNDGLPLFNVYFRVQFYVDSYLFISDKVAKLLYYHQMRENVLLYDQSLCEERAFMLASYALQADYGNYNAKLHKEHYFDPRHYFPLWVIEELGAEYIVRNLPALHCDHKGMSKSEAQSMYIKEASDSTAPHNFHFYKLACKKGSQSSDVWLAITISGVAIYAAESTNARGLKSRISFFPWSDIGKLSFDKKKFEIRSTGSQGRKFVYYSGSEEMARHLLWFSRASHQFHLMVQTKMKEMLKREAEINRRKYRETCVSSTSSSGNSSSSSSGNPSSNHTSKSNSPFDLSSTSTDSACPKKGTSDLDISNSSVCGEDSHSNIDQRVSVISNASSNTTSGIASDKMHGLEDSDRDDIDSDLLMGLNHHHHHHHVVNRAITLSGCSPQPVVSMESLALSEPTEHRSCRNVDVERDSKMNLASNKKHSISISNIMITSSTPSSISSNQSYSDSVDSFSTSADHKTSINTTVVTNAYTPVNEVLVNGENCSKVLCLNINEPSNKESTCCSLSPYAKTIDDEYSDDNSSLAYDEADSVFDNTSKSYTSGKSNVTVLSTILKPEAERLLKQGIEADDAELMIDDGIDSIELAELKEFEQAEKEKIILNSLINNIMPPMMSSSDSDTSDDSSDDDDDVNNNVHNGTGHSCYSPLTQEKMMHKRNTSPQHTRIRTASSSSSSCSSISCSSRGQHFSNVFSAPKPSYAKPFYYKSKPSANQYPFGAQNDQFNHIYENIRRDAPPTQNGSTICPKGSSQRVDPLVTPTKNAAIPTTVPLRQCPSLKTFPTTPYQHRTGMRIGVSSLTRPYTAQKAKLNSLLKGGCIHNTNSLYPSSNGSCCTNLLDMSVGSEPNLFTGNCWNMPTNGARNMASNKSDSVFDCRVAHIGPLSQAEQQSIPKANFASSFGKSVNNRLGSQPALHMSPAKELTPTSKMTLDFANLNLRDRSPVSQDSNNNIEKVYPQAKIAPSLMVNGSPNDECTTPKLTSSAASQTVNKTKDGSISDLHQLRQRSSDLNLPLITALFNDSSLNMSSQFKSDESSDSKMSQSLQQIPNQVERSSPSGPAAVERTNTFRVDEAIAKSALRQNDRNNNTRHNDNLELVKNNCLLSTAPNSGTETGRPISWHVDSIVSSADPRLHHNRTSQQQRDNKLSANSHFYANQRHYTPSQTITSGRMAPKHYNSDFIDRIWAEHQLTT